MELNLKGRNAFVTGANRGIGTAISEALAAEGVNIALFARDETQSEEVAAEIRQRSGVKAVTVKLDLARRDEIRGAVEKAAGVLGGVDILVNCAGGATRGHIKDIDDDAWEANFAVKPLGLIRMTRETLPYLERSDQPRIINISGTRGREPTMLSAVAGPINFATLSLTKTLANDLGPLGITVNAICPGSTDTRRWDELLEITAAKLNVGIEEAQKHLVREVPLGKVVRATDVADLAVFLASARAGMITGTAINVDGGRTRSI